MYQKIDLIGFLDELREFCDSGQSGSAVFFNTDGAWGKISVDQGQILNTQFQGKKDREALPLIKAQSELQFYFRREPPKAGRAGGEVDTERFFQYFNISVILPETHAPAPPQPTGDRLSEAAARRVPHSKKKILVADDSRIARKVICNILIQQGFNVREAQNGFETLGQLENENPDLLLLDLIMPGVDGYKVLESIRKNQRYDHMPVFILTSRDSLMDKLKGRMRHTDEYLTKPVDADILLEKINKYLDSA